MMLAVSTGVDSFVEPTEIGPLYPFVGAEVALFAVALFMWLAWHFLQARGETREHRDACALYDEIGLDRAMHHGGSALIASEEEWTRSSHGGRDVGPDTTDKREPSIDRRMDRPES
ncbi:MAG: hypothetical protein M3N47_12215 [Chloroflexota bacterium]|nr:hypothetical protein [Chloroflexota bacterium]